MAWMAAALTVFVIANLAAMYLWLCQRSLEKSLAPHREINLMPDLNKRVAVGSGDGFGTGTSIAMAPRYRASAPVPAAAAVAAMPAVSAGVATVPPSTPVKAKQAKAKTTSRAKTSKPASVKAPVAKKVAAPKTTTAKASATKAATPKAAPAKAAGKSANTAKADKMDDVSLISGVGPVLKKKLAAAGVTSLKQISKMSVKKLEALDDELNLGGRCISEEWIEQAKELVAGKPPRAKVDKQAAAKS